jgi:hypothetical protein
LFFLPKIFSRSLFSAEGVFDLSTISVIGRR